MFYILAKNRHALPGFPGIRIVEKSKSIEK
jgi:hypothetical protein